MMQVSEPFRTERVSMAKRNAMYQRYGYLGYDLFPEKDKRKESHWYCDGCGFDMTVHVRVAMAPNGQVLYHSAPIVCEACDYPSVRPLTDEEIKAKMEEARKEREAMRAALLTPPQKRLLTPGGQ